MFISDQLVFVELHKTAGSHIGRCLQEILPGRQQGKHNPVPSELHQRFILGSIRNPWDWYVSLWAFGCDGHGSVYHQTSRRFDWGYYWRQLNKEMGRTWLSPGQYVRQCAADAVKPVSQWRDCYADSASPEGFRQWLRLLLDPQRRFDIGEGFGFSPLAQHSGLLTYRFFKLFSDLGQHLYTDPTLGQPHALPKYWEDHRITDFIIRNESLEADLIRGLELAGVDLKAEHRILIEQGKTQKTNTSTRRAADFYYDDETIELVRSRDKLIIQLFDYQPPRVSSDEATS